MKRLANVILILLMGPVLFSIASCPGEEGGDIAWTGSALSLSVSPDGHGGYMGIVIPPTVGHKARVDYPGVTCFRLNHLVLISDVVVNDDGTEVTFKLTFFSEEDLDLAWFRLASTGATLVTTPDVVNGRGENVFVLGPLATGGALTLSLRFNPASSNGYSLDFDFLEIRERVAYSSDLANPGVGNLEELFTISRDFGDKFQLTFDSPNKNVNPVWSPGAEWIAFERLLPNDQCSDGGVHFPTQIFIVHPDGSNLTQIAPHHYKTGHATFNPTGDLLAYSCQAQCDNGDGTVEVCLHDLRTGTEKIWFHGAFSWLDQVQIPRWSPDGAYVIMTAKDPVFHVKRWYYAPVDPLTGDTLQVIDPDTGNPLPLPVPFLANGKTRVFPDGVRHKLETHEWGWAPDSRHAVLRVYDYVMTSSGAWPLKDLGVVALDFFQTIQSPDLPVLPEYEWVAHFADGNPVHPRFDKSGTKVFFHVDPNSTYSELQYTEMLDYTPVDHRSRTAFLADGAYNVTPAPFVPALPEYFPNFQ